jgi:salicylate hydroxylase
LRSLLGNTAADLDEVLNAVLQWRLWPLNARAPMRGAHEHAQGRVALLGDAAHPMRPYLAQGAAMALEDAWTLGQMLSQATAAVRVDWPALLQRWAGLRWRRNAWVQERSRRNGLVFHADGVVRWGRNFAMAALGESLLDVPRLYAGPPLPGSA